MSPATRKAPIWWAVGCVLFLSPLLAYLVVAIDRGNTILLEDALLYSFPMRAFVHDAYTHHFSPQWVPHSACGFSLLAEGQSALCFPATQILYRVCSAPSAWLIEMIAGCLIAFLSCHALLRHLGVRRFSSLFGASVYAFCVPALFAPLIPSMMWCYAMLPAFFWAGARFMEGRPRSSVWLLILIALLLLTGHPVMILYTGMIVLPFLICLAARVLPWKTSPLQAGRRPLILLVLALWAILIALPQLLPMFQQLPFSARTTKAAGGPDINQYTLHMDRSWIAYSLLPTPFDWADQDEFWSIEMNFPAFVLFLVLVGLFCGKKGWHRWYFTGLALFLLLMAMGPHARLWKLVHSVPVLRNFRFPFRWLFFLPLPVSVLAAMGLDRLIEQTRSASSLPFRRVLRFLWIFGIAAEIVYIVVRRDTFLPSVVGALQSRPGLASILWLSSAAMLVAGFLAVRPRVGRKCLELGVSVTILSLLATRAFCLWDTAILRDLRAIGGGTDCLTAEPQLYRTSSGLDLGAASMPHAIGRYYPYVPNVSILAGRLNSGHYCSLIPYWASDMSSWCQETLSGARPHEKILDICSARWVVGPPMESLGKTPIGLRSELVADQRENSRAMPRVTVVPSCIFCANDDDLVATLESPAFDPRQTVALLAKDKTSLDHQTPCDRAPDANSSPAATLRTDRPDRIEVGIEPSASGGSLLVLTDTYYPGWRVFVDGVERNILRANYAFRAVQLPPGARQVVFIFDPLIPDWALVLPTAVLMVMALLLAVPAGTRTSRTMSPTTTALTTQDGRTAVLRPDCNRLTADSSLRTQN